ncbi:MAG: hypothetical protein H6828_04270 [Planctomycetes bacterium]|nr:hypothetical protein [Planctomycetota bacterium]
MRGLRAACAYFALVFGAGFVLGTVRVLLLVPRLGERAAELAETPLMLVVTVLAARWLLRRLDVRRPGEQWVMGLGALALLLAAEVGVVVLARQQTLGEYVRSRDALSGSVYLLALGVFALAPRALGARAAGGRGGTPTAR